MAFRMSLDDVAVLMGGYYPPKDEKQRDAYWNLFISRANASLSESETAAMYLLAGGLPVEFDEWDRSRRSR